LEVTMYWLRLYEMIELRHGHLGHQIAFTYFDEPSRDYVRAGFLNAVNRYYGYQVWR